MIKSKKTCKCGRIFYDVDNNIKCPICLMKRNGKIGAIGVGAVAVGVAVKKHSKEITKIAKTVGEVAIKIAKK